MKTTRFWTTCPFCSARGLSHDGRDAPAERDVSVCASCTEVSVFELEDGKLVLRKPTPDEQELIGFCSERIARFKVPRHVRFVSEWPMSATKIQKYRLRERLLAESSMPDGAVR